MRAAVYHYGEAIAGYRATGDTFGLASALASRCGAASPALAETSNSALMTLEACVRDGEEARAIAARLDWRAGLAYAEAQLMVACTGFGDFDAALRHGEEAMRLASEIEHRQWMALAHFGLGHAHLLLHETGTAITHLESALALARELHSTWWIEMSSTYLARACLAASDLARAHMLLDAAGDGAPHGHDFARRQIRWVLAELSLVQRQPETALAIAQDLLTSAPGGPDRQAIPLLHLLRGEALLALRRGAEAIEALERAQQGAEERDHRPLLPHIHGTRAKAFRVLRRDAEARAARDAARDAIELVAGTIGDARLRARFVAAEMGAIPDMRPDTPRRAAKAAWGGLTAR
jgi:tetratricopeptide (TPR) repeat protein